MTKYFLSSIALIAAATASQAYDFAADFSLANNPNGPWSYGWTPATGGTLDLYDSLTADAQIPGRSDRAQGKADFLAVYRAVPGNVHGITMGVGDVAIHPGPNGERSVARFTAPSAGSFLLSARFDLVDITNDNLPEDTDVDISLNGVSLFAGGLSGYGDAKSYSQTISLSMGDRLDFSVGYGASMIYYNDSTRLTATIAAVPEPAPIAALGVGAVALLRRRRRA